MFPDGFHVAMIVLVMMMTMLFVSMTIMLMVRLIVIVVLLEELIQVLICKEVGVFGGILCVRLVGIRIWIPALIVESIRIAMATRRLRLIVGGDCWIGLCLIGPSRILLAPAGRVSGGIAG